MTSVVVWPSIPYKGLSYYTPQDVALFGGRTSDIRNCARVLTKENTKVLLLHGNTGCGKSSFLRAGLIPFLESEVGRFEFLRTFEIDSTKALFVRCTDQPLYRVCETLFDRGNKPLQTEPPDLPPEEIDLRQIRGEDQDRGAFIEKNARSISSLMQVFKVLSDLLPKTLILVIDQAEEILTQKSGPEGQLDRDLFFDFIAEFSKSSLHLKLVVALRTEYFGMFFNQLKKRRYSQEQLADYFLNELSDLQLVEAINMPTSTKIPAKYLQGRQQPGVYYNFRFEEGLPERIVDDLRAVETKGGLLPVLQILVERLYKRAEYAHRSNKEAAWKIALADYELSGKLETQVDGYVTEKLFNKIDAELPNLTPEQRVEELALWKDLLYELVLVEADNRALTRLRRASDLQKRVKDLGCKTDFYKMMEFLSHEDQRVLRPAEELVDVKTRETHAYYSLGHDAIAVALSKWRETRSLQIDQFSWAKKTVLYTMRGMSLFFLVSGLTLLGISKSGRWSDTREEDIFIFIIVVIYLVGAVLLWIAGKHVSKLTERMLDHLQSIRRVISILRT
jgi:hypothetical protein